MDIRVLRYFLAVAQEESITKAAESLHIAQPSLSKQMMELEKELSKQLLIRGSRKTALTEDGVLLRRRAEEIVELLDRTERELSAGTQTVSGGDCHRRRHKRAALSRAARVFLDAARTSVEA